MQSKERSQIKWAPYNSVINAKDMINDIYDAKVDVMPTLSDEQTNNLEKKIINAYYEQIPINIKFFYHNRIVEKNGTIKKIDFIYHKIYFNNFVLLFDQIINLT
jgi:hypothetical protein